MDMAYQRSSMRGNGNDNMKPKASHVFVDPLSEQLTQEKFRSTQVFAQAMPDQLNLKSNVPMNPNMGATATRIKVISRMNPSEFHGSKVFKDPQGLIF